MKKRDQICLKIYQKNRLRKCRRNRSRNGRKKTCCTNASPRARARHPFVFYEGPSDSERQAWHPPRDGKNAQDSINRYKTMQGYQVKRKGGWDTHGLPVEIEVEKQLSSPARQDMKRTASKNSTKNAANLFPTRICGRRCRPHGLYG